MPNGLELHVAVALVQGLAAFLIVRASGLTMGWQAAQPLLALALLPDLAVAVPAWVWLLGFALLVSLFWNSAGEAVPLYMTNAATARALAGLLPPAARMIDLGSGTAGLLLRLARMRPDVQFVGVESAPLPHIIALLRRSMVAPSNLRLARGDLWQQELAAFDVVYVFLSPAPMPHLLAKARAEMAAGSLLVSNSFTAADDEANERLTLDDRRRTVLHLWHMRPAPSRPERQDPRSAERC